jgi:hypothetical protein
MEDFVLSLTKGFAKANILRNKTGGRGGKGEQEGLFGFSVFPQVS